MCLKVKKIWFNEILTQRQQADWINDFTRMALEHLKKMPKVRFRIIVEELEDVKEH